MASGIQLTVFLILIAFHVDANQVMSGTHTILQDWPDGAKDVVGWQLQYSKPPHHVIVWETSISGSRSMVYIWAGEETEMYPPGTCAKPWLDRYLEIEVHNMHEEPIDIVVTPIVSTGAENELRQIHIFGFAVHHADILDPPASVTTPTGHIEASIDVVAVRMHSHHASRQTLSLDNNVVADTATGAVVNKWIHMNRSALTVSSTCWYDQPSAVGHSKCDGCVPEMCNAYVMMA